MNLFKRSWIWFRRFRHRKGYGVHSPFAFNLITWVIYEKMPYYAYRELDRNFPSSNKKRDRLLFRLVNRMQPDTIVEVGCAEDQSIPFLIAAKRSAACYSLVEEEALDSFKILLNKLPVVDFFYLNRKEDYREVFEMAVSKAGKDSLWVLSGIHGSAQMKKWWEEVKRDERTGITFDLYEVGLVFFDKSRIKQHYIVNF